jgi:hypothetical protein
VKIHRFPASKCNDPVAGWFEPDTDYVKVIPQQPGHIWDWAAKAGVYLHAEGVRLSSHRIAAVVSHFAEPLVKLLRESHREHHHHGREPLLCCPRCTCKSPDGDEPNSDEPCTCGADEWNVRLRAVLEGEE